MRQTGSRYLRDRHHDLAYDADMSAPDDRGEPMLDAGRSLSWQATQLYEDVRLMPMLRKLVKNSCEVADAVGGSVSIVDPDAGHYTKLVEFGTACRLGQTFPLHEGVTGQVVSRRGPVVLRTYRELSTGHLDARHPARDGSVAGIPIWWRGEIVAVNVIFAGVPRVFSVDEVDNLELMTQVVAPGLVDAIDRELPAERRPRRIRGEKDAVLDLLDAGARDGDTGAPSVIELALSVLGVAERAALISDAAPPLLHVAVVGSRSNPRLLMRGDDGPLSGAGGVGTGWHEVEDCDRAGIAVRKVVGQLSGGSAGGSDLRLPTASGRAASPFSFREQEVLELIAEGLSDRAVADILTLSPKTVEKHVSAVLRKTGTTSRTAAVVRCILEGWLSPQAPAAS